MRNQGRLLLLVLILLLVGILVCEPEFLVLAQGDGPRIIEISHNDQGRALTVVYSPGGNILAVGSSIGIRLYTIPGLQPAVFIPGNTWVRTLAFSPNGNLLASGSYDPVVRIWRASDGMLLKELKGHSSWVRDLAFSPDGALLATASDDDTVRLWNVSDGSLFCIFDQSMQGVRALAFSPDGSMLATGGYDRMVRLWSVQDGSLVRELSGHKDWVRTLAFSPTGEWLASGGFDATVRLWRASDGELLLTRDEHSSSVLGLSFSPDGQFLASASVDTSARLWKMPTLEPYALLKGHTGFVYDVAFSPDGRSLASGSADNSVRVWDVPSQPDPAVMQRISTPSNCKACHHPRGNVLEPGRISQPPRVLDVSCTTCHLGGTPGLHWCPAFPRLVSPATPFAVTPIDSNEIGTPQGSSDLSVVISSFGNSEHFYPPNIIAAIPIAGYVYSARNDVQDLAVELEIWSGSRQIAAKVTTPHADGYFFFNTFMGQRDTQLKRPIEQRTCVICHNENLGGRLLVSSGQLHIIVKVSDQDGSQASDERWIVVDQSRTDTIDVHLEIEGEGEDLLGIPVQASTRLYEWRERSFTALSNATGHAALQVEALSAIPTRYEIQVEPVVLNGVLYESAEPVEITLPAGESAVPSVTLRVHATTGQLSGQLSRPPSTAVDVVAVHIPDGAVFRTQSSALGDFSFSRLPIGQYMVSADQDELAGQGWLSQPQPVNLADDPEGWVDLPLMPLSSTALQGIVGQVGGAPIPFAYLTTQETKTAKPVQPDSGRFTLLNLPDGRITLQVTAPGFYSQAHVVAGRPDAPLELELARRPETLTVAWGSGWVTLPSESRAVVNGLQIRLEQGWLWGAGGFGGPRLQVGLPGARIEIDRGSFAIETVPGEPAWLFMFDGEGKLLPEGLQPVVVSAGQMVILAEGLQPIPVTYDPAAISALHVMGDIPLTPVWQPGLEAQIRNGLAMVGISTAQLLTLLTYLGAALAVIAIPVLFLGSLLKKRKGSEDI